MSRGQLPSDIYISDVIRDASMMPDYIKLADPVCVNFLNTVIEPGRLERLREEQVTYFMFPTG